MMNLAGLVVVCLTLASGHGAVLFKSGVHRDLCTWGPQYWCSSDKTAYRCGKMDYCSTKVWPLDIVLDTQCQVTQQVVKNARQLLDSKAYKMGSDHEIALLIAKSCSNFEDDIYRLQCKAVVTNEDILPKLIKLINTKLPTESVAFAVGGCQRKEPISKENCHTCEEVTSSFQQYVAEVLSLDVYLRMFKSSCDKLGAPASRVCMSMAQHKYSAFHEGIVKVRPSKVCSGKSLCLKRNFFAKAQNLDSCTMCKDVVQALRDLDRDQEIQDVVKDLLKSVCSSLGEFKDLCDTLADKGLIYIFEIIATELEPMVICEKFHLCESRSNNVIAASMEKSKSKLKIKSNPMCPICEFVMKKLDSILMKNSTVFSIEAALNRVCDLLPSTIKQECSDLVQQYAPIIVQLLASELQPQQVCTYLGLCQSVSSKALVEKRISKFDGCSLCEFVMAELDSLLQKNSTVMEIEAALNRVCDLLPSTIKPECSDLVQQYSPDIVKFLVSQLQPKQVCTLLKLCPSDSFKASFPLRVGKQKTEVCALCITLMQYVDKFLAKNTTEDKIIANLGKVCDLFPESEKQLCHQFLPLFVDYVVQMIAHKSTPEQICKAIKLCSKDMANEKKTLPVPSTSLAVRKNEVCQLCIFVFEALDNILEENATKEEVIAALDKVCDILPQQIKAQCIPFVQLYASYVVDLVVQALSPKEICATLGICTNSNALNSLKFRSTVTDGPQCELCMYVFSTLEKILKENSSKEEVIAALDKVCDILPQQIKDQCIPFVKLYAPYVVDLVVQALPPKEICAKLGICTNSNALNSLKFRSTVTDGPQCELCMYVFSTLEKILKENSTKEDVTAALDKVCDLLPQQIKDQCIPFVKLYAPYVVDLVVQAFPPKEICAKLGICTNISLLGHYKSVGVIRDSQLCELCEYVFTTLDNILGDNATKTQIETALEEVCNYVPEFLKQECSQLIETYTPVIIKLLLQQIQPKQLCTSIGLCTNVAGKVEIVKAPKAAAGELCVVCEFVMQYIDQTLKENSTRNEIEQVLEEVCNVLPSTIKDECTALIKQYLPLLINFLESQPPKAVCALIGVCPKQGKVEIVKGPKAAAGELCVVCEFVMQYIDQTLKENSTRNEIEQVLEEVCNVLPSTIKDECTALIKQYLPLLINFLESQPPKAVCALIGVCPKQGKVEIVKGPKAAAGELCVVCEFVMQYIDQTLKENSTRNEIEQVLEEVCNVLPSTIKDECTALIKQYLPLLINFLESQPPKAVCALIGVCPKQELPKSTAVELCSVCEFVMKYLEDQLKEYSTQQQLEQVLKQVCKVLPSDMKKECGALIEQYLVIIINLLENKSPKEVCSILDLCTNQLGKSQNVRLPKVKAGTECEICQFVVNYLAGELKDNATQQEVIQALQKVCSILPSTVEQQCDAFIEKYFIYIVQLLEDVSPQVLCNTLKFCPDSGKVEIVKAPKAAAGELCAVCEFVMQYVDQTLKENATQNEIKQVLEQVCNVLPATIKDECTQLIEQYFTVLVQFLENQPPKAVCTLMGLCPKQGKVEMLKAPKAAAGELCAVCEFVMQYVDQTLKENATQNEIKQVLEQVCNVLPATIKNECTQLIEQYFTVLVQFLENQPPKAVCTLLGLCSKQGKFEIVKVPKAAAGELCVVCEFVMQYVDQTLKENATQNEIKQVLEQVCNVLPATIKNECTQLIEQYFTVLVQFLENQPPKAVCTLLGLCSKQGKFEIVKVPKAAAGELCVVCEFVMQYVDQTLKENATQNEIKQVLEQVCNVLPATIKNECTQLIEQYFTVLVQFLENQPPKAVCTLLGLCSKQGKVEIVKVPKAAAGELCVVCEFVMQYVDQTLKENATQNEIKQVLEQVCNVLPATIKDECTQLIEQYFTVLVQILENQPPKAVCTLLGLCSKQGKVEIVKVPKAAAGELCAVCEFVMQYVDQTLKENATQNEIKQVLEQVCNVLPATIKDECTQLIEQYFTVLVQFLENQPPKAVCTLLGLCSKQGRVEIVKAPKAAAGELCAVCEFVMQYVDQTLKDNATQNEIKQVLEQVCNVLPATIKDECTQLIEQYFTVLVQFLENQPPNAVCTLLGLCDKQGNGAVLKEKKSSGACTICDVLMGILETQLERNITEKEIEKFLDEICTKLPSDLKPLCDTLIQDYVPTLMKMLVAKIPPQDICTFIKLCKKEEKKQPAPSLVEKSHLKSQTVCEICETVMDKLETLITSKPSEQEVAAALEKVCSILPKDIQDKCKNFVELYAPYVLQLLTQEVTPKMFCTFIKLCSNSDGRDFSIQRKISSFPKAFPQCVLCEYVISTLEKMLEGNSSQAKIEAALDKVCNQLPSSITSECVTLVDLYAPQVIDLLVKKLDPKKLCTVLKLCSNSTVQEVKAVKSKDVSVTGISCDLCELVMGKLKTMFGSHATEAEIESALEKVCDYVPSLVKAECDELVQKYTPLIIKFILDDISTEEICAKLGLCSSYSEVVKPKDVSVTGVSCELCEIVMGKLKTMIGSHATEAEIESALEKVCDFVPSLVKAECDELVQKYTPLIIKFILDDISTEEICAKLGLCSSYSEVKVVKSKDVSVTGVSCVLCELVMGKLKTMFGSHATEAEIESALEKVCDYVPSILKAECDELIQKFTSEIIKLILDDIPTEEICAKLGLCSSFTKIVQYESIEGCTLCKFLLEELKGFIEDSATEVEAMKGMDYICNHLPTNLRNPCKDLVLMFGPNIIQYLGNVIDSKRICQLVHLCAPQKKQASSNSLLFVYESEMKVSESEMKATPAPSYNLSCTACKFAWYEIQTALATPYWKTETKTILLHLCQHITTWPDVCKYLVNENLPGLVSEIRSFRFPIEFCQEVNMCAPQINGVSTSLSLRGKNGECEICQALVEIADAFIQKKSTVAEVEAALTRVCKTVVPEAERPQCVSIVEEYSSVLLKLLAQYTDPKKVCQIIELCPKVNPFDAFNVVRRGRY